MCTTLMCTAQIHDRSYGMHTSVHVSVVFRCVALLRTLNVLALGHLSFNSMLVPLARSLRVRRPASVVRQGRDAGASCSLLA